MKTALVVALCAGFAGHANASCADDRVTVTGDWGRANFAVSVADHASEPCLASSTLHCSIWQ